MREARVWVLSPRQNDWLRCLLDQGYRLRRFERSDHFCREYRAMGIEQAAAVLLMADVASNCQAARGVRAQGHTMPLLAVATQATGAESAALLSLGVDHIVRPGDKPDSLLSLLRALDYRRTQTRDSAEPQTPVSIDRRAGSHRIGPWWLDEQGWRLVHGANAGLRLTSAERALLLSIFEAPGHVLSHEVLMAVLLKDWTTRRCRTMLNRIACRAVVGRLRARAQRADLPRLPLESVRDFGYIWTF